VNLTENPIFLTQKRLIHRAGVLAAGLIAALVGLSLLSGLIAYLADPRDFDFKSPQEAGRIFYGWTIGVEILVLVIGGFSRISQALANDRKAGLWDSNRLTPLKPREIVTGYWFGSALREVYMGAILAGIGLVIVILAKLPVTLWLGTQILILSTTLFFGLLASLVGMALQRPQNGIGILLVVSFAFLQVFSFMFTRLAITNFLLPSYGIVNLFLDGSRAVNDYDTPDWLAWPGIFGLPVPPIILSVALQFAVGIFLWRATVRKTANPFQPLLLRWEAMAIFGLVAALQHGLIWEVWHGRFGVQLHNHSDYAANGQPLLAITHGGMLLLGMALLALASPLPERVRVEALRTGSGNLRMIFSRSAISLALALSGIASAALLMQFVRSFREEGLAWALATGNLFAFLLMFSLLLEYCRLRFKRRAVGFIALWLFVLCVLPFILAGVFSSEVLAKLSFLAPGTVVLAGPETGDLEFLAGCTFIHFFVVVLLFYAWQREWKSLLATPASLPPAR